MSKKYFIFYRLYYDLINELEEHQALQFIKSLLKVQFSENNTYDEALKVKFYDLFLDSAWSKVLIQLKKRDRHSKEYAQWRSSIFERDLYTCQFCDDRACKLNAHHIVRWVDSIELRFELSNGITLCEDCHKKVHKWDIDL